MNRNQPRRGASRLATLLRRLAPLIGAVAVMSAVAVLPIGEPAQRVCVGMVLLGALVAGGSGPGRPPIARPPTKQGGGHGLVAAFPMGASPAA